MAEYGITLSFIPILILYVIALIASLINPYDGIIAFLSVTIILFVLIQTTKEKKKSLG